MWTICKRELKSYFTSMMGYVITAFILLLVGVYFTAYQMQVGYPVFGYTLSGTTFIFLIVTPILTMRSLAEEKKQKTDQLLLTSPLSVSSIVIGKYLALVGVFLLSVIIISFYPAIMAKYGEISYGSTYAAVLGFFLLGAANIAIGLFISSITESQIIAAVVTFAILFVCYMMNGIEGFFSETAVTSYVVFAILVVALCAAVAYVIKNTFLPAVMGIVAEAVLLALFIAKQSIYEGAVQKLLGIFHISDHFSNFVNGMLDINGIVYYLSVIVLFLFLTVQSIQKRRWS